ncbi:hypothetical protein FBZ90_103343 [Nitrospirillum pindoramense]|uniref:Uncharacterized protein n=1 Tax=Nitrospirillum amazonense TaxID=28077 RepID=A0A560HDG9_9PROT|nr:hypothetical protein FBZ90_103343 [Nitrospirillum amazonense]
MIMRYVLYVVVNLIIGILLTSASLWSGDRFLSREVYCLLGYVSSSSQFMDGRISKGWAVGIQILSLIIYFLASGLERLGWDGL